MQTRVRFRMLKQAAARVFVNHTFGSLVGRVLHEHIPCRGCVFDTSRSVVSGEVKAMLLLGMYESAEQRFVARYLRDDCDVVELGSSLGVVTSQIARRMRSGNRLVAVEANEDLLPTLRANVARNAPGADVTVLHGAIDYGGSAYVQLAVDGATFCSHVSPGATGSTRRVRSLTLTDVVDSERIRNFVLVSDIEGGEAGVFLDGPETLSRCSQIICELHDTQYAGRGYSADDLASVLQDRHGFRLEDRFGNVAVFDRP